MSKYFDLDKDDGAESSNSKALTNYLTVALIIISVVAAFRWLSSAGENARLYGVSNPSSSSSAKYYESGTGNLKLVDVRSLYGNAINAITYDGSDTLGTITYEGYAGEIHMDGSEWGLHKFHITEYGGDEDRDVTVSIAFKGGFKKPLSKYYGTRLYRVEG